MVRLTYGERLDNFRAALGRVRQSEDAERSIIELIKDQAFDGASRSSALAALGDTHGSLGSDLLRQELRSALEGYRTAAKSKRFECVYVAGTCIGALARREGPGATPEFLAADRHANDEIHDAGLTTMAAHGDDRVWDEWLDRLADDLRTKISSRKRNRDVTYIIRYLARHSTQGSERADRLIDLLRERWGHLLETDEIEYQWPGIGPGGGTWDQVDLTSELKPPRPRPPRFAGRRA
jgi:hypothetical protein